MYSSRRIITNIPVYLVFLKFYSIDDKKLIKTKKIKNDSENLLWIQGISRQNQPIFPTESIFENTQNKRLLSGWAPVLVAGSQLSHTLYITENITKSNTANRLVPKAHRVIGSSKLYVSCSKQKFMFIMIIVMFAVLSAITGNTGAVQRDLLYIKNPGGLNQNLNEIQYDYTDSSNINNRNESVSTRSFGNISKGVILNIDKTTEPTIALQVSNFSNFTTTARSILNASIVSSSSLIDNNNINTLAGFTIGTTSAIRSTTEPQDDVPNGPFFDKAASKNVTALLGKTAYLNCRVKNMGNKTMLLQVSWVRHRDVHLLTVGRYTYTSDQRFRAIHQPQTEDWILQIKYPQHRDSGVYECQVSTMTHMSHYVHLDVVEPSTEIIGAPDVYIESGSTINLTCIIMNSPEPPAYIYWNHNNAIISYDSSRGGVSVVTNKGEVTTSFLLIKSANPSDSGHYQCNPSNAKPKSVTVHVLNGKFPAAMQRAGQAHHRMSQRNYILVYLSTYFLTLLYVKQLTQLYGVDYAVGA